MLNIFNLFLFLLTLWVGLMALAPSFEIYYLFLGIIASAAISFISYKNNFLKKDGHILCLSTGFYKFFTAIYFKNFLSSIYLLIKVAFDHAQSPSLHKIRLKPNNRFSVGLLISSINMSSGIFCIECKENDILVHALNRDYFKNFDLQQTCVKLSQINDDDII